MELMPNNQGEPYIFISYPHQIREQANIVTRVLQSSGYRVWFDSGLVAGSSYNEVIAERIIGCEVFCCLLSKEYYNSEYCRQEFIFAKEELKKPIIPVYVGEIKDVKASLPAGIKLWLAGVHAITLKGEDTLLRQIEASGLVSKCRGEEGHSFTDDGKQTEIEASGLVSMRRGENCHSSTDGGKQTEIQKGPISTVSIGMGIFTEEEYRIQNLIFVGDELPIEVSKIFCTVYDNQTGIHFKLYTNLSHDEFIDSCETETGMPKDTNPSLDIKYLCDAKLEFAKKLPKTTMIKLIFRLTTEGLEVKAILKETGEIISDLNFPIE